MLIIIWAFIGAVVRFGGVLSNGRYFINTSECGDHSYRGKAYSVRYIKKLINEDRIVCLI